MTRSGIKRGLAISAVSALSVVGLPAAAHAASDADYSAITASVSATTAGAYQYVTVTGKVTPKSGVDLTAVANTVTLSLSQTLAVGTATTAGDAFSVVDADGTTTTAGTTVLGTVAAGDAPVTGTTTVAVAKDGTFKFQVGSKYAGALKITEGLTASGGTTSENVAVSSLSSGAASVKKIVVAPSSVAEYDNDGSPTYTVTAEDASGLPVPGVDVDYTLNGGAAVTVGGITSSAFGTVGQTTFTVAESAAAATDSLVFYVDAPASTKVGLDSADPQAAATAKFTTAPTTVNAAKTSATLTVDSALPADKTATSVPVSFTLLQADGKTPVANASVRVTYYVGSAGDATDTATSVVLTSDAAGKVSYSVPVTADQDVAGTKIGIAAGLSMTKTGGTPVNVFTGTYAQVGHVVARDVFVSANGSKETDATADVYVTAGGSVSIPLTVADQFGKPASGTLSYTRMHDVTDRGNDTTAPQSVVVSNGVATISYTDADKTGVTAGDTDTITIADPFNVLGATQTTTPLEITVHYLKSVTPDAKNSKFGDIDATFSPATGFTYTSTVGNVDPNSAADTAGKPTAASVVSADPTALAGHTAANAAGGTAAAPNQADLGYNVRAMSSDATPVAIPGASVTYSAPNGVLIDAQTGTAGLGTLTVKTDANGDAPVILTAVKAGTVTLTATTGGFSHTFNPVKFDADLAYNLSPAAGNPTNITPGESAKFLYTVTDEFGNPVYGTGADGINPNFDAAGNFKAFFIPSTGLASQPGTITNGSGLDSNSQFNVQVSTTSNESGAGSVVVKPSAAGWQSAVYAPVGAPSALSALLTSFTDPAGAGVSQPFTVKTPVVTQPGGGDTTPPPAKPAIKTAKGHSQGKKDVLVVRVANANGKRVVVRVHGHKVGTAVVKNGKAVIKVRDHNGKKATKYTAAIGKVKKAFKVK